MKKSLLILLVFLFSSDIYAQSWVAPGATWLFKISNLHVPYVDGFLEMSNTGTITIDGRVCDQIDGNRYGVWGQYPFFLFPLTGAEQLITYREGGVIYYLTSSNPLRFDTLANYNANIGDGWYSGKGWDSANCSQYNINMRKIVVADTGHIVINGFNLKKLQIGIPPNSYNIVERIGRLAFYFYEHYCCGIDCWNNLGYFSCYKDDLFPVYSVSFPSNCNFVGLDENSPPTELAMVYPNPSNGIFKLYAFAPSNLIIKNLDGKLILQKRIEKSGLQEINISSSPDGIYFVTLSTNQTFYNFKVSKAQF